MSNISAVLVFVKLQRDVCYTQTQREWLERSGDFTLATHLPTSVRFCQYIPLS